MTFEHEEGDPIQTEESKALVRRLENEEITVSEATKISQRKHFYEKVKHKIRAFELSHQESESLRKALINEMQLDPDVIVRAQGIKLGQKEAARTDEAQVNSRIPESLQGIINRASGYEKRNAKVEPKESARETDPRTIISGEQDDSTTNRGSKND